MGHQATGNKGTYQAPCNQRLSPGYSSESEPELHGVLHDKGNPKQEQRDNDREKAGISTK